MDLESLIEKHLKNYPKSNYCKDTQFAEIQNGRHSIYSAQFLFTNFQQIEIGASVIPLLV